MTTANEITELMLGMHNEAQRQILARFFKTGPGEYGEGDKFIGMKVPQTRAIVKEARLDVPLGEIEKLLYSEWHDVRLCALLLLVEEMKAVLPKRTRKKAASDSNALPMRLAERRDEIARFYHHRRVAASSVCRRQLAQPRQSRPSCRKRQPLGAAHSHCVYQYAHPQPPV